MTQPNTTLRRRALRIEQDSKHPLYLFALTADELLQIADVSRVSRDEAGKLIGYQRPEVRRHVKNITDYLDSGSVLFPNSIILAMSSSVVFQEVRGPKIDTNGTAAGTITLALPKQGGRKPAWIVDGQQRALALAKSRNRSFLVPVSGFVADDLDVQRDQFVRINTARPLPVSLVNELLPEMSTALPSNLSVRKAPSALCDLLNRHPDSPFRGLLKRPSSQDAHGIVTDTALIKTLQESLYSPTGVLFAFRNVGTGETDFDAALSVLILYWSAVRDTWPEAWGKPAVRSRLMHSAGIRSVGRLMDRMIAAINVGDKHASSLLRAELHKLRPYCQWTSGTWKGVSAEPLAWNAIQNTPSHIRQLSSFLIRTYASVRWSGA